MAEQQSFNVVAEEPQPSFFSNVIAIVGFIILIVVVIWGLIHLASLSRGWFSGLFTKQTPSIAITVPAQVQAGDAFNVSWKYATSDKGNYALLYSCSKGLAVKLGGSFAVPCGAAFTIGATTSVSMISTLTGTTTAPLQLSVIFLPSATSSKQAQGSAKVTVNSGTPGTTALGTPVITAPAKNNSAPKPAVATAATPHYNGPADISVRIIAIGVIDSITGQFVARAPSSPNEMVAAQFDIANVGASPTGTYYFSAVLPTVDGYTYSSPAQASLEPGDHVVNTLRWTESAPNGAFSVQVTANRDSNSSNNYASQWIGGYTTYNDYNPQPQPTYYYPQYTY